MQSQIDPGKSSLNAQRLKESFNQSDIDSQKQRNALAAQIAAAQQDSALTASSQARVALAQQEQKAYEAELLIIFKVLQMKQILMFQKSKLSYLNLIRLFLQLVITKLSILLMLQLQLVLQKL